MKRTKVCNMLGISQPILQAGLPWVSNPELVAAVSNAGGLGILHPTAGIDLDGDIVTNLQANIRRVQRLTANPFGIALYLPSPRDGRSQRRAALFERTSSAAPWCRCGHR